MRATSPSLLSRAGRGALVFAGALSLLCASAGCAPLSSVACDQAAALCANVDQDACDATLDLVPPRVRDELLGCSSRARTCAEITSCFASYQLPLPLRVFVVD